ncbi:ABC transporter ATP-binding protein [Cryobacterium sp. TMT2-18-3]|uniref:ABC transporter ATP-binding protein n=1 Tax=unclassified Cryobacterium TaxID=2649013 RepID=UPI00106AD36A|nr:MULTISPECIES: ABC transporter ATP-binding protein [unclassified Cryobacterium]TFC31962.1 ABC transporter ATP-binding protein [Cryobacterium sp. TMT2-18-2]TFC34009.1 ABC transporter ATP-binding protein [Cryobacterium sp. TMT2-42-4]TFC62874.1 ABC transporter ATP-binding protein [Cryobacterium sp. TMT2-18-3]
MTAAIELSGVDKSFGSARILEDIALSVPEGSRTVVVGSSGSGKTTLLRLISGFELPDSGTISVLGRTVAGPGVAVAAHRRGIGFVAQDGALFPHLTVGQNIAFGLGPALRGGTRKQRARAVSELLEMVSLRPDFAARRPDELSGGQQQRVALARALARQPRVMLLDEPFSSLDAGLRAATRDIVAETLERAGITTVLVTHDQAEAMSFAHQLAVLRDGNLCQVGPPREVYWRPVDLFTARFLGDAVVLPATISDGFAACALGTVAVAPTSLRGDACIMLRPEQIMVEHCESGGVDGASAASCTGQVEAVDFYGPEVQLAVRLFSGGAPAPGFSQSFGTQSPGTLVHVRQHGTMGTVVGSRVSLTARGTATAFAARP